MLEDAEREYLAAVEDDPAEPTARQRLALIALRGGDPEAALEHLDALPSGDGDGARLRNRAVALEQLGRYGEALESLELALSARPDDPRLALARGIVRFKDRRPERALESFGKYRKLLGSEAPTPIYFAYAVLAAAAAGRMDEALHLGREGLTLYPGSGPILVNLGVVLERRGESDAAEALYLRAVGESPPPAQAHKNLGDLAYRRGDQAGARAHYERALRLDPGLGDDLYLKLGNLAYKDGDREWAVQLWIKALELNPGNEVVRTNLDLVASAPGR
jgi:tetratricopeptide (TPR) repeat protein